MAASMHVAEANLLRLTIRNPNHVRAGRVRVTVIITVGLARAHHEQVIITVGLARAHHE